LRAAELGAVGGAEARKGKLKLPSRQRGEEDRVRACTTSLTRELGVFAKRDSLEFIFWYEGPMQFLNGSFFPSKSKNSSYYAYGSHWAC
jgi:hypothetical protein